MIVINFTSRGYHLCNSVFARECASCNGKKQTHLGTGEAHIAEFQRSECPIWHSSTAIQSVGSVITGRFVVLSLFFPLLGRLVPSAGEACLLDNTFNLFVRDDKARPMVVERDATFSGTQEAKKKKIQGCVTSTQRGMMGPHRPGGQPASQRAVSQNPR